MPANVALTSLYKSLNPAVYAAAQMYMDWPYSGTPFPADYVAGQCDSFCQRLRQQPIGCRTAQLNHILEWETTISGANAVDPVQVFRNGMSIVRQRRGLTPLSRRLKYAKLPIDLIFCDLETGFNYWQIGVAGVQAILKDPTCRKNLPANIAAINPSWFDNWSDPKNFNSIRMWNRWNAMFLCSMIKAVVLDSGLFDIPDKTGLIKRPTVVNYSWSIQRWSTVDSNGWTYPNVSVDGVSSCPTVYLSPPDWSALTSLVHESLWNRLIYSINAIRTTLGTAGTRTFPVVDWPSGRNAWVWEQLVAHSIYAGVTRNNGNWFLYWDPYQQQQDDDFAATVLAKYDYAAPKPKALPQIPYDSDTITTNGFTTTYTDFLAQTNATIASLAAGVVQPVQGKP